MKCALSSLAALLLCAAPLNAQDAAAVPPTQQAANATTGWTAVWQRLEIRQNANVKKDIAKPAFITFTAPADKSPTYQIGMGLLVGLLSGTLVDLDFLADYQKNTAIDSAQDLFKTGMTGEWQLLAMGDKGAKNSPLVTLRSNYKSLLRRICG